MHKLPFAYPVFSLVSYSNEVNSLKYFFGSFEGKLLIISTRKNQRLTLVQNDNFAFEIIFLFF
ncbi:hypothetical protein BC008_38960 [Mastigocoleus testarum BC008]|uniref:Uncharacterized protein n=1 Tax=Mastigocoleus testarum BC008 TaxID=371196 RepID=A0A0V7ZFB1_9CYAN|nr:hypothetical protein BC008_38960 [Mastigocoleus testarum BC008]